MNKKFLYMSITFLVAGFINAFLRYIGIQHTGQLYYLVGLIVSEIWHHNEEKEGK